MKFLITIESASELISYEAIALAFVLASFDHEVCLFLTQGAFEVLMDKTSRLYGMIQSLPLYDLPKAWTSFDETQYAQLDDVIQQVIMPKPKQVPAFDTYLQF